MRKSIFKKAFCRKGFTLIEAVVVIAIMAILATVISPMLMASSKSKTNEKYKQYVLSVLDSAQLIAEAYNSGAKKVAGYEIVDNNGHINWTQIANCLTTDNSYAYQFQIRCRNSTMLNSMTNPTGENYRVKDTVEVYFWYDVDTLSFLPAGAWYIKMGVAIPAYKYDYTIGSGIENTENFSDPFDN